jgi:hypothetical protein
MSHRRRTSYRLECGCTVTLDAIEESCAACEAQWAERHEQAHRDHFLGLPIVVDPTLPPGHFELRKVVQ